MWDVASSILSRKNRTAFYGDLAQRSGAFFFLLFLVFPDQGKFSFSILPAEYHVARGDLYFRRFTWFLSSVVIFKRILRGH